MKRPGDRLRALATQVFDEDTMERLVDPVIADLQTEYAEASRAGQVWRRRWVSLGGYIAFAKVSVRPLRVFLTVMSAVTLLMMVPPYLQSARFMTFARLLYLLPQALVIAVPFALMIALGWSRPVRRSRQWLRAMIAAGVICSAFCFVTLAWWTPAANQAFRVSMAREFGASFPPRGLPELTIGELRREMNSPTPVDASLRERITHELTFTYYMHWALPCASLSFALLMIALHRRGVRRRWLLLSVLPIVFGYYVLLFVGRFYAIGGGISELTASAAAWMPNAIMILIASAIFALGAAQRATE
jgi:lipopolysaccharide export LptBFGC system permease protein LptF